MPKLNSDLFRFANYLLRGVLGNWENKDSQRVTLSLPLILLSFGERHTVSVEN